MLELQIYSPTEDGFIKEIEWNHEEIRKEVAQKMMDYSAVVYTEDQIKEAKADRAKLNKFLAALEGKRKEVKKLCLAPYEDFERKMKEITTIVGSSIASIDNQVKDYEEQAREEKKQAIIEYFKSLPVIEGYESLELARIWNDKWLNASVSLKKVQEEISSIMGEIKDNIDMLFSIPEYGFEAAAIYKTTLDPRQAVAEAQRHYELQKQKEEAMMRQKEEEERRRAEAEAQAVKVEAEIVQEDIEMPEIAEDVEIVEPEAVRKEWITFKAHMSVDDALALKAFFESRNIVFKAVETW